MILITLSIFALLPAFYPLRLLINKCDVNLFDLVILFHSLNFAISPLFYGYKLDLDDGIIFREFLYYISFILLMLFMSFIWHNKSEKKEHIINITRFIGNYKEIKISLIGRILLCIAIAISLVFYLPRATYILHIPKIRNYHPIHD